MKIYIVIEAYATDYQGDDKRIVAVFSNEDMAKKYAWEDCKSTRRLSYDYEEHEVISS